jgi:sulfite reductase (NADPH) flavoprotein alpha-component
LVANLKLNGPGSAKDTRHFEFALEDSGLAYEAGDALGVLPENCGGLVREILSALHFSGEEEVSGRAGAKVPIRQALLSHYEITRIPHAFLSAMAERTDDPCLKKLASPGANGDLASFLRGREIIDLLLANPHAQIDPEEFVGLLKGLQPRLYSVSSSGKAHPGRVHLTVNVVRYESLARARKGVCSTYLADRTTPPATVPVFIQSNANFRPPADMDVPMIMVGPGTGVAPFRGFLQERKATGARGRNWLFFGDQRSDCDFMYRDELESMLREGTLTRLDTAFSRDQEQKVYVQDRMREHAAEIFAWLEAGAHFYVCGDAARMAKDVDVALRQVIQTAGQRTPDQADEYVESLRSQRRYQRDVY